MTCHQRQAVQAPRTQTPIMLNLNQRFKQSTQRVASRPYPRSPRMDAAGFLRVLAFAWVDFRRCHGARWLRPEWPASMPMIRATSPPTGRNRGHSEQSEHSDPLR